MQDATQPASSLGTSADVEAFRLRRFIERLIELGECDVHDQPIDFVDVAAVLDGNARAVLFTAASVMFERGRFHVAGTGRSIGLFEVAAMAVEFAEEALEAASDITTPLPTFPNGCHVCEVEIDPDTGAVTIVRYAAVDDVGRIINPLLVHGQMHGSTVQGAGQALTEDCIYDRASGQLLSGSFMDYALPRADMFPSLTVATHEVLAPNNPLGVKGAGESGSTGAPAAFINAVVDALREFGVRDVPMPATPERVWRAIRNKIVCQDRRRLFVERGAHQENDE